jgi:glutamyl-Q tRNA(Asp) synthetase
MMNNSHADGVIGRFAPSPTGPLHFGSLLAAVGSYCLARQTGGRWLLRIEDLDAPRTVPGAADQQLRTLEAFGLEWDGDIVWQSRRQGAYEAALQQLRQQGAIFDCGCSRREILASAPHPGEEGPVYPGTCRAGLAEGALPRAVRLRVPGEPITFVDAVFGIVCQGLAAAVGDFVLRRADGLFAYQLAVVVDDAAAGVNQVVRGADLLSSTPRQIFLQRCLGLPAPNYAHLPLALGHDGEKISKRHGDLSLLPGEEGRDLWRALRFLGQQLPEELAGESASEILRWAVPHFDVRRVPRQNRTIFAREGRAFTRSDRDKALADGPQAPSPLE